MHHFFAHFDKQRLLSTIQHLFKVYERLPAKTKLCYCGIYSQGGCLCSKGRPYYCLSSALFFWLPAAVLQENSSAPGASPENITAEEEITITATNYSFDQEEYHLKKGVPVKIIFSNKSGNHGILVPGLELRLDAKAPSQVIIPEKAGTYEMTCAIMCGSGHSSMSAKLIVE